MQFHHHGYVSGEPRVQDAAGTGIDRPAELPDEMDVLIVGSGPAGMLLAAQLSQFPDVTTRIIERRDGRLVLGQADGIQPRSVETFQAFGFAERIVAEAYNIAYMNFWGPDPENPRQHRPHDAHRGLRASRSASSRTSSSTRRACSTTSPRRRRTGPAASCPTTASSSSGSPCTTSGEYPGRGAACGTPPGERAGRGAHGAREVRRRVRRRPQRRARGDRAQARRRRLGARVGRHGRAGQHRLPRLAHQVRDQLRGGQHPAHPARGRLPQPHVHRPRRGRRRTTTTACARRRSRRSSARRTTILHPYSIDVKQVAWHSVYEVGHRVTDKFDDVPDGDGPRSARLPHRRRVPHAQRQGRAGHERVDAGRVQPGLEARARADRPQPRVAARDVLRRAPAGRAAAHRLRPRVVLAHGAQARGDLRPAGPRRPTTWRPPSSPPDS